MPRSTREWALRKLDAANNTLDWFDKHILEVADKYSKGHMEIAEPLVEVAFASGILKDCILKVREKI